MATCDAQGNGTASSAHHIYIFSHLPPPISCKTKNIYQLIVIYMYTYGQNDFRLRGSIPGQRGILAVFHTREANLLMTIC